MNVVIDPYFDAYYCSFYLAGIAEVFGPQAVRISHDDFPDMRWPHSVALILQPDGRRIFIDTQDSSAYYRDALSWCDVYAKINVDPTEDADEARRKVLAIGPSFGIRQWGLAQMARHAAGHYWKCRSEFDGYRSYREYFANYWRQYHYRLPLAAYSHEPSRGNYIFFVSALWKQERECNEYRANFIVASRSVPGLEFEGGFAPRRPDDIRGFETLAVKRRYALDEYLRRLKRSLVAFNTPAVYGCLGWKLAEYLALGKAIISTPLNRSLPAPLEHGRHIHLVDGSFDEIKNAVKLLSEDNAYRRLLENNARNYFLEYLAPARCIERIVRS
jgi:hypothetical protein